MLRRSFAKLLLFSAALAMPLAQAAEIPTKDGGHVQNPQWSPDGQWLAFETNNMANTVELWLVKFNGGAAGTPAQLKIPGSSSSFGTGGYVAASPVWATKPSLMVIFEGSNPGGQMRLYYATPGAAAPNELITAQQQPGNLGAPAISSNGKRFAFISDATGKGDLYVWEVDSGQMRLTFATDVSENNPTWNSNGDVVVFSRKNMGNEDLYTWTGGSVTPPLKGGAGDQTRPRFAGDKVVYFTAERGEGHWDIATTDLQGNRTIIAQDVRLPARAGPALTPDGGAVVYTSSIPEKGDVVLITRVDGSKTTEIPTGLIACGEPAVVSAGGRTWLAFTALPAEGADWRSLHVIDVTGKL